MLSFIYNNYTHSIHLRDIADSAHISVGECCRRFQSMVRTSPNQYLLEYRIARSKEDEVFFFHSGGSVTISGGEVLAQADFAEAVLRSCMKEGIPTAIESSLYADYSQIQKLLPYPNTMYIDFKIADESAHLKYTGISNQKIRENLLRIDRDFPTGIHIRIPSIPGINLTVEHMQETAHLLSQLIIDKEIADAEWFGCTPGINTAHLKIKTEDLLKKFLPKIYHRAKIVEL